MLLWMSLVAQLSFAADTSGAMTPERLAYYQRGLPAARSFVAKSIPEDLLTPLDAGNTSYLEVLDAAKAKIGYLRDFTGAVSPANACPCNPLRLTLVFDANAQFVTLISPEPLQKLGHAPMSADEQALLIKLVKAPPPGLLAVPRVEGMVDVTTGATRVALKDVVVPQAALSTRRIAGLVRDTAALLQGAPAGRDRQRLRALLAAKLPDAQRCQRLAELMGALESEDLREQTYRLLGSAYATLLSRGGKPVPKVEEALLAPPLPRAQAGRVLCDACNEVADRGLHPPLLDRCVALLTDPKGPPAPAADVALLRGTAAFTADKLADAEPALRAATRDYPIEMAPKLYLRLSQAQAALKHTSDACETARNLNRVHPLLAGAADTLQSCVPPAASVEAVRAEVQTQARQALVQDVRPSRGPAPALELDGDDGKPVTLALGDPGQITVAVFFATWCPHCRAELPRIKAFVADLPEAWRKRVRVVGVRTAVEREMEPYATFTSSFALNFPVYADSTMSLAFVRFAKYAGIGAGLPTLAVLDTTGELRYLLPAGDNRDTAQELRWVVEAELLRQGAKTN